MTFPKHLLTDEEQLILDLRPHWWFLAPSASVLFAAVVLGVVALGNDWASPIKLTAGVLVLGTLGYFGIIYSRWSTTNFVVTTERVISRTGVVAKRGIEIPLDRINTVFFNQSLFERLIGAGDLGIESAGEGGRQTFTNIRKPSLVQNEIYRQKEGYEGRRLRKLSSAATAGPAESATPVASIPEQIEKLDQLRRQGVITDQEFEIKKRELLDRM
jgi:uncharacterized membrane protein YdbT with pleckstrin-like domain